MSLWYPDSSIVSSPSTLQLSMQSGFAMVTTLILLLVITAMGVAIAYVASVQNDLVAAVSDKPLSVEAGEACVDDAIDWLSTLSGRNWLSSVSPTKDVITIQNKSSNDPDDLTNPKDLLRPIVGPLLGKTALAINRGSYSSCLIAVINANPVENIGGEVGTLTGYTSRTFTYDILITSTGNVTNGVAASSKTNLEVALRFTP